MCFSAEASFASAALLLPLGMASVWRSCRAGEMGLLPLALMPVGFGLQQALEGGVWLGLSQGSLAALPRMAALAYLFFALALWPSWIPFMALRLSAPGRQSWHVNQQRLPLLLQPERIEPRVVNGSIDYGLSLLLGGGAAEYIPALYAAVVAGPLLLLPSAKLRNFGIALMVSGVVSQWFYRHAFASVWCYFSAVLSGLIIWMVWSEPSVCSRPGS